MLERLGPDIQKVSEIAGEMTVQIPNSYSSKFKDFFEDFDNQLEDLGIQSYGISITTLEQVFLKIGNMDDPSELFTKKEYENGTEMQTEMGATTGHLGKTILKPTAMNSSLMPNVSPMEGDTFRDDSKQEGSTLVNLNATDGTFKNPRDHFNELNEAREDYNESPQNKRSLAATPTATAAVSAQ